MERRKKNQNIRTEKVFNEKKRQKSKISVTDAPTGQSFTSNKVDKEFTQVVSFGWNYHLKIFHATCVKRKKKKKKN